MAEAVDDLLVKLGLEVDAKGFKEANTQFSNIRTTALATGAAIGTAVAGMAKISFDVAKSADDLAKWSRTAGVTAQYAHKLGFAMKQIGGSDSDARTLIELANSLRDSSKWGELPARAFTAAGFNPQQIDQQKMSPEQVIEFLSSGLSAMGLDQRRQIGGALGINDKAFRLLSDRAGMQSNFRRADELGAIPSDELLKNSEAFVTATGELKEVMEGFKKSIAGEMLPGMTKIVESITGFSVDNREEIGKFFEEATPYLQATAAGIAVLVAAQVGKKGLEAMGGVTGTATFAAKAGGIGALISAWDWGPDDVESLIGVRPPDWLFKPLFGGSGSASGPLSTNALFDALIQQESGGRHYGDGSMLLSSPKGARGVTQVMPATGRDPGYGVRPLANDSREEYLRFGRDYLAAMMKEFDGDTQKALAAYNAGPGAVKNAVASHGANWLSAMPGETQAYVPSIMGAASRNSSVTINVDARGSTDPAMTEERVRKVIDHRIGEMVTVGRDGISNNVQ
ncbi:lytic transglycosylase domain-containing protein [Stutzerimonas kunmingensis]|uniref:lytic transglycosylase domain-containing protein n=1 Tax=Stutzerimonas kunmingensis TaxID=1211807 RepID=UPI0028ABAF2E|nr:lytic transglycosylase domain-containing protein [Stutzerimonas kunmingensis]